MTYVAEPLPLEGLPRQLFVCTPTRLTTWLDCPLRYRMTYLDRPAPQRGLPWAHNSFGASVHTALAAWWRLRLADRTPRRAGELLERGFLTDGFRDDAQLALHRGRARAMVEAYVAQLDPEDEPIGIERTVSLRTDTLAASGRVDRLDLRGTILSWSTTSPGGTSSRSTTHGRRWPSRSMPSRPPVRSARRADGSSCTTCRPVACWRGSTPTKVSPTS